MSTRWYDQGRYLASDSKDLAIILFHAYTSSHQDMTLLARRLHKEGWGVYCPLFTGHGTGDVMALVETSPQAWAQDSRQALAKVRQAGYASVMVFGLSLGGILATYLMTLEETDILAGGIFNSPLLLDQTPDLTDSFRAYTEKVYHQQGQEDLLEKDWPAILQGHLDQIQALDEFKAGLEGELHQVHQPFYMAQSGQDEIIDPEKALAIPQALVNAQVSLETFPRHTHVITVGKHRQVFEDSVIRFIYSALDPKEACHDPQ